MSQSGRGRGLQSHYHRLVLLACMLAWLNSASAVNTATATATISINASHFRVELAESAAQRTRGLMLRKLLGADQGMLFIYPQAGNHRIWMKNTLIPLQVIWIDDDFRIITIRQLKPCRTSSCEIYSAAAPSRYILEISDQERGFSIGDRVDGIPSGD